MFMKVYLLIEDFNIFVELIADIIRKLFGIGVLGIFLQIHIYT